MENKQLQQAKDAVAKKYGYVSFDSYYIMENRASQRIVNEVAIEYNKIMGELQEADSQWIDVKDEKEEEPVLVGYLNKEFGYQNHFPVKLGTEVFSLKDRYFFNSKTLNGIEDRMVFYKDTLQYAIDFIQQLPNPPKK